MFPAGSKINFFQFLVGCLRMKNIFWFVCLLSSVETSNLYQNSVASAISQVIRDSEAFQKENLAFVTFASTSKLPLLNDILNEVLKKSEVLAVVVQAKGSKIDLNQSSLLLFDTLTSYQTFSNETVLGNEHPKEFHFLVYIWNFNFEQAGSLSTKGSLEPSTLFRHQSFLVHKSNEQDLSLITFVTFQQPNCRDWKIVNVNQFSRSLNVWSSQEFFIDKFENFNNCELGITAPYPHQPTIGVNFDQENRPSIWGYGVTFNQQISRALNYSFFFNPHNLQTNEKFNKTRPVDFYIYSTSMRRIFAEGANARVTTQRFTTVDNIILLSQNKPYSQLEKIFLPYDIEVWHFLIATICCAVAVILILKLAPKETRDFVFGEKVQTPLLNLVWAQRREKLFWISKLVNFQ